MPGLYPGPPLSPEIPQEIRALPLEPEPAPPSPNDLNSFELMAHADVDQLSLEIEKERYTQLYIQPSTLFYIFLITLQS